MCVVGSLTITSLQIYCRECFKIIIFKWLTSSKVMGMLFWLAFHFIMLGVCSQSCMRRHVSSTCRRSTTISHHSCVNCTLVEGSMADRLQVSSTRLQVSSRLGSVLPCRRTAPSSRLGVSKTSAFSFVTRRTRPVSYTHLTLPTIYSV